jgi:thermitase
MYHQGIHSLNRHVDSLGRPVRQRLESCLNERVSITIRGYGVTGFVVLFILILGAPGIWVGYAIAPDSGTMVQSPSAVERLIVRLHEPLRPALSNSSYREIAATDVRSIQDTGSLSGVYTLGYDSTDAAAEALRSLEHSPSVVWIEPDYLLEYAFSQSDSLAQDQVWIDSIDLHAAWNITTGSPTVIVAVVDSGVSQTHPDLQGKVLPGYDFLNDHPEPVDEVGHGTAVAGIIGARGGDGSGITGVAMDTMILPVKVGSVDGSPISAIAAGTVWAVDQGAHVINLSLGSDFPSEALHDAMRYAYERGVPVIAAAGNEPTSISYPGAYPETISVGASTAWGTLTGFTSRANRVDIVAPGTSVLTTWSGGPEGDTWAHVTGTSFAAPMVSGTVALLLALDPALSIEGLRSLVTETAIPVGDPDPEPGAGAGQLDAGAALSGFLARAFDERWSPADRPVAAGSADRTWVWGPDPIATGFESYDQATHGERLIRYYDKARMEITDPAALRHDPWFVTNGLLARELISGQVQIGDQAFLTRQPARIIVAGDWGDSNSPTYADFGTVLSAPPASTGAPLIERIDAAGRVHADSRFTDYNVFAAWYVIETNHQIASVFWTYLNSLGLIEMGGELTMGPLFSPTFYATGLPITEAYWVEVHVNGVLTDVLVQCFERRCLTYTPSNPENWQVEMGNVGQHYFNWRYSDDHVSIPPRTPTIRLLTSTTS